MITREAKLRIGRSTDNLEEIAKMYVEGLGFELMWEFNNHGGFSGKMIGHPKHYYHLEFTKHTTEKAGKSPSKENLLIFYLPNSEEYEAAIERISTSGFKKVKSFNPYWEREGETFEDLDGYRVVINHTESPF